MTHSEAQYIVAHYGYLMSDREKAAFRHLSATLKATKGKSDPAAQEAARERMNLAGVFSNDPDVLRLAKDGYESFVSNTAERILQEHADKTTCNVCPQMW